MTRYLVFLLKYLSFYVLLFMALKGLFLLVSSDESLQLGAGEVIRIFLYGLKLDVSLAGYLVVLSAVFVMIQVLFGKSFAFYFKYFNRLLIHVFLVLHLVDAQLFQHWGFRLDLTPLKYLKSPALAMASVSLHEALLFLIAWPLLGHILTKGFTKWVKFPENQPFFKTPTVAVLLLFAGLMIIPIRGGLDVAPLNIGSVYFSEKPFANQAAINVVWNIGYAITKKNELEDVHFKYSTEKMQDVYDSLQRPFRKERSGIVLQKHPNVLMVILESFTSKLLHYRYKGEEVTPFFNELSNNSLFFEQVYASGDRTDKGLVSLLSGYPAQSLTSIIQYPAKVSSLPNLFNTFKEHGYNTSFLYGGDIDFAGMNAYLVNASIDKVIDKSYFPSNTYGAKWGVHDHISMDTLIAHIGRQNSPWFHTWLTLSLHEPYDVPMNQVFPGQNGEIKMLNSARYVDITLEKLVGKLKENGLWDDLLLVFVADHGHPYPEKSTIFDPEKYKIPLVFSGGALKNSFEKIPVITSQDDVPAILLSLMDWQDKDYVFSKNTLAKQDQGFAYFCFNNGFGWLEKGGQYVFDRKGNRIVSNTFSRKPEYAHIYMDFLLSDFVSR